MWYSKSQQQLRLPQTVRPVSSMTCSDAVRCFHVSRCEMAQPTRKVIWAPRDIRDKSCKRLAMAVGFHGFKWFKCSDASLYRRWTFNCLCSFLMGFYGSGWVGGYLADGFRAFFTRKIQFTQHACQEVCMQHRSRLEAIPRQTGARVEKTKTWSFLLLSHTVWTTWLICPCVHNVLLLHDLWHLHLRLLVLPGVLKGPLKNVKHDTSYEVLCNLCQLSGASRNPMVSFTSRGYMPHMPRKAGSYT